MHASNYSVFLAPSRVPQLYTYPPHIFREVHTLSITRSTKCVVDMGIGTPPKPDQREKLETYTKNESSFGKGSERIFICRKHFCLLLVINFYYFVSRRED